MGNSSFLSEYLVRIGFDVDMVGYSKYAAALRDAEGAVNLHTSSIAKSFLTWQTAAVGMFASVGAGVLGLVDKVVMGDQEFRLLGLRMYTTTSNARELKIAMDALGQPLENIAWDPELYRRFLQLVHDQQQMTKSLGPDFEKQMVQLRDYRFELTRLGVEMQYLAMRVVKDLGTVFGFDLSKKFNDLKTFNDWLTTHLPEAAEWVESKLVPILRDVRDVLGETLQLFKAMGTAFTNMVGIISGDKSLQTSAANFDQFARAVQHALGWIKDFVDGIIHAEEAALHVINAAAALKNRDYATMRAELSKARQSITPTSGALAGAVIGSIVPGLGTISGGLVGAGIGLLGGTASGYTDLATQFNRDTEDQTAVYAKYAAQKLGIPADLILAQWKFETENFTKIAAQNNLGGFRIPGTKTYQNFSSLQDFADAYVRTLSGKRYGGLSLPQTPEEMAAFLKRGSYYEAPEKQYAAGLRRYDEVLRPMTAHNSYRVDVQVNVTHPGASAEEIGKVVQNKVSDQMQKQTQRNLQEFTEQGYSY